LARAPGRARRLAGALRRARCVAVRALGQRLPAGTPGPGLAARFRPRPDPAVARRAAGRTRPAGARAAAAAARRRTGEGAGALLLRNLTRRRAPWPARARASALHVQPFAVDQGQHLVLVAEVEIARHRMLQATGGVAEAQALQVVPARDRKSTRLNSSHVKNSYAV